MEWSKSCYALQACHTHGLCESEARLAFVLITMFLPPKVSILDTPNSSSLQTLTENTRPSFCTDFSYGSEKLYETCAANNACQLWCHQSQLKYIISINAQEKISHSKVVPQGFCHLCAPRKTWGRQGVQVHLARYVGVYLSPGLGIGAARLSGQENRVQPVSFLSAS